MAVSLADYPHSCHCFPRLSSHSYNTLFPRLISTPYCQPRTSQFYVPCYCGSLSFCLCFHRFQPDSFQVPSHLSVSLAATLTHCFLSFNHTFLSIHHSAPPSHIGIVHFPFTTATSIGAYLFTTTPPIVTRPFTILYHWKYPLIALQLPLAPLQRCINTDSSSHRWILISLPSPSSLPQINL
jgi:hypothetical protein